MDGNANAGSGATPAARRVCIGAAKPVQIRQKPCPDTHHGHEASLIPLTCTRPVGQVLGNKDYHGSSANEQDHFAY